MAKFDHIRRRYKKFLALDEKKVLTEVLADKFLHAEMVDLNQAQLYEKGLQADGTPTGDYADITVAYYKPLAESEGRDGRSDHITGKDTGETYRSMHVEAKPEGIVISADDRNDFFLRIDKGLGLTKESKKEILPAIREMVVDKLRAALKG